jgi:succinate dehydrogenase hydrophobic anchor subunit
MTGPPPAARRFLGRPDEAYPGFVPGASPPEVRSAPDTHHEAHQRTRSAASRLWMVQALTGGFLLIFLGMHLVAQHFLAPGGLRDYTAVIAYLREPLALVAELGLLVSVVVHACAGMRASLVDVIANPAHLRIASIVIAFVGVLAGGYAVWLTYSVLAAATAV